MRESKVSIVVITSAIGVIALAVSQLIWMRHSWHLAEQIFNQRVSMALCSTVEKYKGGMLCDNGACSGGPGQQFVVSAGHDLPTELMYDTVFLAQLTRSLHFHQIDLDYELSLTETKQCQVNVYQSTVLLPTEGGGRREAYLRLIFPNKNGYILRSMNFMVVATILILIFVTAVLLLVNWSLVRQKRLLQTNVDFFNHMAHEFITPLNNIGLAVNMLHKKHPALKDHPLMDVIRRENGQLLGEVERVLHLARLDKGEHALQKENFPLKALLQAAVSSMAMPLTERQGRVNLDEVPEDLEVYGDGKHLASVFRNLLDNALKYTRLQPDIRISARKTPQGILVSVEDNGIGIPPEQRNLIFEKFQRAHHGGPLGGGQKGFGLGLAYVKSMIELHKGYIRVFSEENKGSRFDIFLPA